MADRTPSSQRSRAQFKGCLLGGAVGDALGAPIEFMSRSAILSAFGAAGLDDYAPAFGRLGSITDDTQMSLFTAEGLLRTFVRSAMRGIPANAASVTARAYRRWLATQGEPPAHDVDPSDSASGWLIREMALHARRAPGNTCLAALRAMPAGGGPAKNQSKGCGGVMRVAPVALYMWRLQLEEGADQAFELAVELSALTHGHPTGQLAGGVLAATVHELLAGASLPHAVKKATAILQSKPDHEETLAAVKHAETLAASTAPAPDAIAQLGQGWVAEEALAIALYCALVATDFSAGVLMAVNHDGDSDSTGAIAGNLLGAQHGVGAIPRPWLEQLELHDVIEQVADDLYDFLTWPIGEYAPSEVNDPIWDRYPGH